MGKKIVEQVKTAESTISMFFGVIVVIIVGILLFNYFKGLKPSSLTTEEQEKSQITPAQEISAGTEGKIVENLPEKYEVKSGDSLWKISSALFGSGYNWVDIAKANNLSDPGNIQAGQILIVPKVATKKITVLVNKTQDLVSPIVENSYKIQKGDSLWNISVRAYQDGYRWSEIAKANNIMDPNIIHVDNVLVIPR